MTPEIKRELAKVPTADLIHYIDGRLRLLNRVHMGATRKELERALARLNTLRWVDLDGGRAGMYKTVIKGDKSHD